MVHVLVEIGQLSDWYLFCLLFAQSLLLMKHTSGIHIYKPCSFDEFFLKLCILIDVMLCYALTLLSNVILRSEHVHTCPNLQHSWWANQSGKCNLVVIIVFFYCFYMKKIIDW